MSQTSTDPPTALFEIASTRVLTDKNANTGAIMFWFAPSTSDTIMPTIKQARIKRCTKTFSVLSETVSEISGPLLQDRLNRLTKIHAFSKSVEGELQALYNVFAASDVPTAITGLILQSSRLQGLIYAVLMNCLYSDRAKPTPAFAELIGWQNDLSGAITKFDTAVFNLHAIVGVDPNYYVIVESHDKAFKFVELQRMDNSPLIVKLKVGEKLPVELATAYSDIYSAARSLSSLILKFVTRSQELSIAHCNHFTDSASTAWDDFVKKYPAKA